VFIFTQYNVGVFDLVDDVVDDAFMFDCFCFRTKYLAFLQCIFHDMSLASASTVSSDIIEVFIIALNAEPFRLALSANSNIFGVKLMIARHEGIAQSAQQLMFGDVILDDRLSLTDHGIGHGDLVQLVQCEGVLTPHQCIVCGLENIFHEVTKACGPCSVRQSREMQYFQPAADVRDAKFMSPAV
jgi:hypothetical protein